MRKRLLFILLVTILITAIFSPAFAATHTNPDRETIEQKIEEVALRRGIPSVIMKSIARVESSFTQFTSNGRPFISSTNDIGVMQINDRSSFDRDMLKYDIDYNIEVGANILLYKWDYVKNTLPSIGDMDPNVLENWYFVLWAYNGWSKVNNPNTGYKNLAYQEQVFLMADREYNQPVTVIDRGQLPSSGLPSKNGQYETPTPSHTGDILLYEYGDRLASYSWTKIDLYDGPSGKKISKLSPSTEMVVIGAPVLMNGYYWEPVRGLNDPFEGWVLRNWVEKTGDYQMGVYSDVNDPVLQNQLRVLGTEGIMQGYEDLFEPLEFLHQEELAVILTRAFAIETQESQDFSMVSVSDWAQDSVSQVVNAGLMTLDEGSFNGEHLVTQEEFLGTIIRLTESGAAFRGLDETRVDPSTLPVNLPVDLFVYMTREDTARLIYNLFTENQNLYS
jgi:hypothetical protein